MAKRRHRSRRYRPRRSRRTRSTRRARSYQKRRRGRRGYSRRYTRRRRARIPRTFFRLNPPVRAAGEIDIEADAAGGTTICVIDPYQIPPELIAQGRQRHTNYVRMRNSYKVIFTAPVRQGKHLRGREEFFWPSATTNFPAPIDVFICEIWLNLNYMTARNHNWLVDGNKRNFLLPLPNNINYMADDYDAHHPNPAFMSGAVINAAFSHMLAYGNVNDDLMPFWKRKLDRRFARWGRKKVRRYHPRMLAFGVKQDVNAGVLQNDWYSYEVYAPQTITMEMHFRNKHLTFDAQDEHKDGMVPAQVRSAVFERLSAKPSVRGWRRYVIAGMTHSQNEQLELDDYNVGGIDMKVLEERYWTTNNPHIRDLEEL